MWRSDSEFDTVGTDYDVKKDQKELKLAAFIYSRKLMIGWIKASYRTAWKELV